MISMREAYEKIGANYDDACARLMGEGMHALQQQYAATMSALREAAE